MATESIMSGLFGITPEAYQAEQNQQALAQSAQLAQQDPTIYNKWRYGKELKALEQTHADGYAPFCPGKWETSFAVGFLYYIYH